MFMALQTTVNKGQASKQKMSLWFDRMSLLHVSLKPHSYLTVLHLFHTAVTLKIGKGHKHCHATKIISRWRCSRERQHEVLTRPNGPTRTGLHIRPAHKREWKGGDSAAGVLRPVLGQAHLPTPFFQPRLNQTQPTQPVGYPMAGNVNSVHPKREPWNQFNENDTVSSILQSQAIIFNSGHHVTTETQSWHFSHNASKWGSFPTRRHYAMAAAVMEKKKKSPFTQSTQVYRTGTSCLCAFIRQNQTKHSLLPARHPPPPNTHTH